MAMRAKLRNAFNAEISEAIRLYQQSELDEAFTHFERAHILGQPYIIPHTRSHWWMLKVGWKRGSFKEIFGQLNRIFAAIIFSRIWVPLGNTGGANVNPLKSMPLPDDLARILNDKS